MTIKDNRITSIIRLSGQAFGKYKLQIVVVSVLGIISGLLEGIGVNAIIPLFSFVAKSGEKSSDGVSRIIEQFFGYLHITFSLKYLLIFISLLFVLKAVVLLISIYVRVKIFTGYEAETRKELFDKTLKANWPYLLKQKLGYLEKVLMIDMQFSSLMLQHISSAIMLVTSLLIYILIAVNISISITLITLILGGVLFLFLKPLIYKTRVVAGQTAAVDKIISHFVNENILGIKTVKSMLVSSQLIKNASDYFNKLRLYKIKTFLLKNVTGSFLQPISLIFICVVFAFSYKTPNFNPASFFVVIYLIQRIFQYIQQLELNLHNINESFPYLKNVLSYQKQADENKEADQATGQFEFKKALEFNKVKFFYQFDKSVLSDVNFIIKKGELVGLIGPSGAGKTTVVDLILRLFSPQSGRILLDGRAIDEISLAEWRGNIGYVSQDIFLINDSFAKNIKFYDDSIDDQKMMEAAKMANIFDVIQGYPEKFDTVIGERGVLLSAGQRQRVIIARVLARQPQLLILDEATSALDNESEIKIQKVIENLKGKISVFVIAHRLSTVVNSDKLLVLENGSITEYGRPQELLKDKSSYFYKVYNIRKI